MYGKKTMWQNVFLAEVDNGDSDTSQLHFFRMEGAHLMHAFQFLVDDLHKDAVTLAVENAYLFLAEEDSFVKEVVQHVEGFFGAVAAEVESGVEVGSLLVHLVEDGGKGLA